MFPICNTLSATLVQHFIHTPPHLSGSYLDHIYLSDLGRIRPRETQTYHTDHYWVYCGQTSQNKLQVNSCSYLSVHALNRVLTVCVFIIGHKSCNTLSILKGKQCSESPNLVYKIVFHLKHLIATSLLTAYFRLNYKLLLSLK